jgi:hypothetical protein
MTMPRRHRRPDFSRPGALSHLQHSKGKHRRKDFHNTSKGTAARDWARVLLPELHTGADVTAGAPTPIRSGGRYRGSTRA